MADAASEMVERGFDVRVLTSARGYADPTIRYPRRETLDGVEVIRFPLSSLGKRTILHRLIGQSMFLLQAIIRGSFTPRLAGILVSTSPPMASIAALAIRLIRRVPIKFWVMDLNPDQAVAMGAVPPNGLAAKAFDWLNRRILGASSDVVVLDRFMSDRINTKRDVSEKIFVIPPWPHEDELTTVPRENNRFIERYDLSDKFVVMYSGNHGLTTPVDTLVEAALRLQEHPKLRFLFIGGGAGKKVVDEAIAKHHSANLLSLPYQPLDQIKYSLSAADVHVVSLEDSLVGIIHPCKIYGAMAVGRPILYFGPEPSHVTEVMDEGDLGWHVQQGDVDGAVRLLVELAKLPREELDVKGRSGQKLIRDRYSKRRLCDAFIDVISRGLPQPANMHSSESIMIRSDADRAATPATSSQSSHA